MVVAIARMLLWAAIAQIRLRSRPTVSPGSHPIRGPHSPGLRQQLRLGLLLRAAPGGAFLGNGNYRAAPPCRHRCGSDRLALPLRGSLPEVGVVLDGPPTDLFVCDHISEYAL
jgi:hypothetical protein